MCTMAQAHPREKEEERRKGRGKGGGRGGEGEIGARQAYRSSRINSSGQAR